MKINTCHLTLKTNKEVKQDAAKLRGYIGNTFKEYPILHNHFSESNILYSYPLVQFQVINGEASILGIEEGATLLKKLASEIIELKLSDSYYKVEEQILNEKEYNVGTSRKELHYQFCTPWLALNTKNHPKYKAMQSWKDRKLFLNNILVGNILSMSKGLGIIVDRKIYAKSILNPGSVRFKSIDMLGFTGEFKVRYNIPDFFGLGKGVSQGFGTVKRVFDDEPQEESKKEVEEVVNEE